MSLVMGDGLAQGHLLFSLDFLDSKHLLDGVGVQSVAREHK